MRKTNADIEARYLAGQAETELSKALLRQNVKPVTVGALDDSVRAVANPYPPKLVERQASRAKRGPPVEIFGIKAEIVCESEKIPIDNKR